MILFHFPFSKTQKYQPKFHKLHVLVICWTGQSSVCAYMLLYLGIYSICNFMFFAENMKKKNPTVSAKPAKMAIMVNRQENKKLPKIKILVPQWETEVMGVTAAQPCSLPEEGGKPPTWRGAAKMAATPYPSLLIDQDSCPSYCSTPLCQSAARGQAAWWAAFLNIQWWGEGATMKRPWKWYHKL